MLFKSTKLCIISGCLINELSRIQTNFLCGLGKQKLTWTLHLQMLLNPRTEQLLSKFVLNLKFYSLLISFVKSIINHFEVYKNMLSCCNLKTNPLINNYRNLLLCFLLKGIILCLLIEKDLLCYVFKIDHGWVLFYHSIVFILLITQFITAVYQALLFLL